MKNIIALIAFLSFGLYSQAQAKTFAELFPELAGEYPKIAEELAKLDYKQGKVQLANGVAELNIGQDFYFFDTTDARYVLETIWDNPPNENTLGMIFPADMTPYHHGNWGVEIYYEDIGYVSDAEAEGYDYSSLMSEMKRDVRAGNAWRRENNYSEMELVGWAAEPFYDQSTRKLHWAKELKFSDTETNTLNYNIRALGRRGVLVMNFIAEIESLPEIETAMPAVLAMSSFTAGNTYEEFDPSLDKVAAVGIGGLIAGKALAKTGFLAVALVFLKKFWFVLLIPFFWLKNLFARRD